MRDCFSSGRYNFYYKNRSAVFRTRRINRNRIFRNDNFFYRYISYSDTRFVKIIDILHLNNFFYNSTKILIPFFDILYIIRLDSKTRDGFSSKKFKNFILFYKVGKPSYRGRRLVFGIIKINNYTK